MKSFRSTGILAVFVIAIAAYTYWDFKKTQGKEESDIQEVSFFQFKNDDVNKILLKTKDADVELKKDGVQWNMVRPIADMADNSAVEAFLYSVIAHKGKSFRDQDEEKSQGSLDAFGLNPPASKLEIATAQTSEVIEIGSKNAYDGSFYVLQNSKVYLSDTGTAQIIARSPESFRSKQMWRDPNVTIEWAEAEVNLPDLKSKFKIVQEGELWTLDPKPPFEVDKSKVAYWLLRVEQLTGVDVMKDGPTPEDNKHYLLTKPSLIVKFHHKDPKAQEGQWVLTAGQDIAEDVYMHTSDRRTIYRGLKPNFAKIRVPLEFFRDGKKAFHFPVEQAAEIEVPVGHKKFVFVKDGSSWKIKDSEVAKVSHVNVEKLVAMIQSISALEAQEFVSAKVAKAFKAERKIVIRNSQGELLLELNWGGLFPGQWPDTKKIQFISVKSNLEPDVMALKPADVLNLIDPKLVEDGPAGTSAVKVKK